MTKHARLLFVAVTAALAIGNVASFVYYQNSTAADPGHRELAYYQLRVHGSNTLAGVSESHPSLQISGPLHRYYLLQESLRGASIRVPAGVNIDTWAWRHIVFADLRFDPRTAAVRPRAAIPDQARIGHRKGALVVGATPDQIRREPLVLVRAGGGTWQIVPEADVS